MTSFDDYEDINALEELYSARGITGISVCGQRDQGYQFHILVEVMTRNAKCKPKKEYGQEMG